MSSIKIPGYKVVEKIGSGSMGFVYKATQINLDRTVALKILAPSLSDDKEYIRRFLRETRLIAKLRHEHIISGIDAGEVEGVYYLVTEYVDGETVKQILKREGKMEERRVQEIVLQIAKALDYLSRSDLVHRDIKPSNLMVTSEGVAKLCDLGLAKETTNDPGLTMTGTSMGTPNYISPEQASGEKSVDIRSDIYSLGATAYHMLTGTTPFTGKSPQEVMLKHLQEKLIPPKERNPRIGDRLNNVIVKMMAKERAKRYQTPSELIDDLEPSVALPVRAAKEQSTQTKHKPLRAALSTLKTETRRRKKISRIVVTAAIAVVVLILANYVFNRLDERSHRNDGDRPADKPSARAPNPEFESDIAQYRQVRDKLFRDGTLNMVSTPWRMLKEFRDKYRSGDFSGEWQAEIDAFIVMANKNLAKKWEEDRKAVLALVAGNKLLDAILAIKQLPDGLKYFEKNPDIPRKSIPTAYGEECEKLIAETIENLEKRFRNDREAILKAETPRRAWNMSFDLENYITEITPPLLDKLHQLRREIAERSVNELLRSEPSFNLFGDAGELIADIRSLNKSNVHVNAYLDNVQKEIVKRREDYVRRLAEESARKYAIFASRFEWHLFVRDYDAARSEVINFLDPETSDITGDLWQIIFGNQWESCFAPVLAIVKNRSADSLQSAEEVEKLLIAAANAQTSSKGIALIHDARTILLLEDFAHRAEEGLEYMQKTENKEKINLAGTVTPKERAIGAIVLQRDRSARRTKATVTFVSAVLTAKPPHDEIVSFDFVRKCGINHIPDENFAEFAKRSAHVAKDRWKEAYEASAPLRFQCGIFYLYAGLYANASAELAEAAKSSSAFCSRYQEMAKSRQKDRQRYDLQKIFAGLFGEKLAVREGQQEALYTFNAPGDLDQWLIFPIPNNDGSAQVQGGRLVCSGSVGLVWKAKIADDARIEMDVEILNGQSQLALLLYCQPGREMLSGYAAEISPQDGDSYFPHGIYRQPIPFGNPKANKRESYIHKKVVGLTPPFKMKIALERKGNELRLSINGVEAAFGRIDNPESGLIGFRTYHTDIAIDNIKITGKVN